MKIIFLLFYVLNGSPGFLEVGSNISKKRGEVGGVLLSNFKSLEILCSINQYIRKLYLEILQAVWNNAVLGERRRRYKIDFMYHFKFSQYFMRQPKPSVQFRFPIMTECIYCILLQRKSFVTTICACQISNQSKVLPHSRVSVSTFRDIFKKLYDSTSVMTTRTGLSTTIWFILVQR